MTQGLTAADILSAWELGQGRRPLDRAIALLWAAGVPGDVADLPLEERDRLLLTLRQDTFGDRLTAVTSCPDCGTELEVVLEAHALATALTAPAPEPLGQGAAALAVRALTSRDLAAAAAVDETERPALLRQRLTGRNRDLPKRLRARADAVIEARAEASELSLALACAECGTDWREPLDVAGHVWAEIAAAARRIMTEVADIAAAFSWSEADILAMSETRRRGYLTLARGG